MKKLGLIAGTGDLPVAVAEEARARGYRVVAVGLEPFADKALAGAVDEMHWISVGKLGSIIGALKDSGATQAVMAGKIPKSLLYKSTIIPDLRAVKLLFSLRDRADDSILLGITDELAKDGITLLDITEFSTGLLTPEGVLTKRKPSEAQWQDIRFGWDMAKEMGRLDIGQTVVIKNLAVMAVEAIEGTDEAVRRGGKLANGEAVVVKVAKPQQDMRFDVPAAGLDTIRTMQEVKARVLALEAGRSILIGREKVITAAEEADIIIVGYKPSG